MRPGALDLTELNHCPDANEEAKGKDEPPKPSVLVPHEVSVAFDDQRPLGKRETETG